MPTQITSAGITFNDATSLTSANIGTSQLANGSATASKLGTNEQKQICKAWVNFNGTTSPGTIRSSYNVSSVTKHAAGQYTVNFTSPMTDANYSVSSGVLENLQGAARINNITTSSVGLLTVNASGSAYTDSSFVAMQVFGN